MEEGENHALLRVTPAARSSARAEILQADGDHGL